MLEVSVFLDEDDLYNGKKSYEHILRHLMHHNIVGASLFAMAGGYGNKHHLNLPRRFGTTDEGPVMILFIDEEAKVRAVLPHLKEVIQEGLIVVKSVERI